MRTGAWIGFVAAFALANQVSAGPLPGAIFTTLPDGTRVNANIYTNMLDVYLDGGPGPNAPAKAAGLPEGDYYFQVTDPSGQKLLSLDPVASRRVHVNAAGVIDMVYPAPTITEIKGKVKSLWSTHATGIDVDHPEEGAITVQLMPYKETPNKGGVYKAWMTPVAQFVGDPTLVDNGYYAGYYHGFIPAWSKTDDYKVRIGGGGGPSRDWWHSLYVFKFADLNADGDWGDDEPAIPWLVSATDPLGASNDYWTPIGIVALDAWGNAAVPWTCVVTEQTPAHWLQTVVASGTSSSNLVVQPLSPTVSVTYTLHENQARWVVFGNVPLGSIVIGKFYDRNGNGLRDAEEPAIADWVFHLDGITVRGEEVHLTAATDASGFATFADLLPGSYRVTEDLPDATWVCTTAPYVDIELAGGQNVTNTFGNAKTGTDADFGTKGYWHNKNGLDETTANDIAYLNSLLPWQSASSYFGAGDEPLDGFFADGTPVEAVTGSWGELLAAAGTALAEQSHFLVDSNAGGDPREQLAQQLDAFIMNARHRLVFGSAIWVPAPDGGAWVTTTDLIASAIEIWAAGTAEEQIAVASLLDALNNSDALLHIEWTP